jgi:hypothetical protein
MLSNIHDRKLVALRPAEVILSMCRRIRRSENNTTKNRLRPAEPQPNVMAFALWLDARPGGAHAPIRQDSLHLAIGATTIVPE